MRRRLRATGRTAFGALRIRNYRLFFIGQLVSVSGTWMQFVAQDWLVLQLTGSALAVGIVTALQFLPILVGGAWGGLVVDRVDKRKLLMCTQAAMGTVALGLGLVTALGIVNVWMIYGFAFLLGCGTMFDNPARQAFLGEMVGTERLPNAVALNSAAVTSARIFGPALAGVLVGWLGAGSAFIVNGLSFFVVIFTLRAMDPGMLFREPHEKVRGRVADGLREVARIPVLRRTLVLLAVIAVFGINFRVALPLLTRFAFDADASVYGTLASVMAVGSLIGALIAAAKPEVSERRTIVAGALFGLLSVIAALMPTALTLGVVLVPMGAMAIIFMTGSNALLQRHTRPEMRGRVMALFGIVFLGSNPVGAPLVGLAAEVAGPRFAVFVGGAISLVAAVVAAGFAVRRQRSTRAAAVDVPAESTYEPAAA